MNNWSDVGEAVKRLAEIKEEIEKVDSSEKRAKPEHFETIKNIATTRDIALSETKLEFNKQMVDAGGNIEEINRLAIASDTVLAETTEKYEKLIHETSTAHYKLYSDKRNALKNEDNQLREEIEAFVKNCDEAKEIREEIVKGRKPWWESNPSGDVLIKEFSEGKVIYNYGKLHGNFGYIPQYRETVNIVLYRDIPKPEEITVKNADYYPQGR